MKYLLFLILSLILFSCEPSTKENTSQYKTSKIIYDNLPYYPYDIRVYYKADDFSIISEDITISNPEEAFFEIKHKTPIVVNTRFEKYNYDTFLEAGSTITMHIESDEKVKHFSGDNEKENNYVRAYYADSTYHAIFPKYDTTLEEFVASNEDLHQYSNYLLDSLYQEKNYFYNMMKASYLGMKGYTIQGYVKGFYKGDDKEELLDKYYIPEFYENQNHFATYIREGWVFTYYDRVLLPRLMNEKWGDEKDSLIKKNSYSITLMEVAKTSLIEGLYKPYITSKLFEIVKMPNSFNGKKYETVSQIMENYKSVISENAYSNYLEIFEETGKVQKMLAEKQIMPSFQLATEENEKELNFENYSKPVLIDVWASWCAPCINSFPEVEEIRKKYENQIEVISISIDNKKEDFLAGLKKTPPPTDEFYFAKKGFDSEFAEYFNIVSIPQYLFINENNELQAIGYLSDIEKLLSEKFD